MRKSFKPVVAGATALCLAGVISAAGATNASAATQPFDPTTDFNWVGTVSIYDATGHVVTSGDATNPLSAQYMVGSVTPAGANHITSIKLYNPQPAVNPGSWSGVQTNGNTAYPILTAPAVVSSATTPQGAQLATSNSFTGAIGSGGFIPNTGALTNVFQIRLVNAGNVLYNATTITIDPVTNVWQQIDPVVADSTKTALTVSGPSTVDTSASPTLTATVSRTAGTQAPVPAGNVQFKDGAALVGSPVAVNASGVATLPVTGLTAGIKSYNAVFTPTAPTVWITSTSANVALTVTAILVSPTVGLSATAMAPYLGIADTFTATVTAPAAPGTIQFMDGATPLGAVIAAAPYTLTTSTLALGVHPITAKFVPTDTATYNTVTSPVVSINVLAVQLGACATTPANCTSAGTFTAEVAAGSLVIHTPYTVAAPFNLGLLALDASGTMLSSGPKTFGVGNDGNSVTITDTRSGGLGWIASLQSSDFTVSGTSSLINARNLGFTQVLPSYLSGNGLNAATNPVATHDNAASSPAVEPTNTSGAGGLAASKPFADIATHLVNGVSVGGVGSVQVNGNMTLNAPTSTPAGIYFGTVTFTIA